MRRWRGPAGAIAFSFLCACASASVHADAPSAAAPEPGAQDEVARLVIAGQRAEEEAEPARADEYYARALELAPGTRLGRRAELRLRWLRARAEGGYVPLARMLAALRAPGDRASLERFAAEVDAFPHGLVRAEASAFVAQGLARIEGERRSWWMQRVAIGLFFLFALSALALGGRTLFARATWRERFSPKRLGAAVYVLILPGVIGYLYDRATWDTFATWAALGGAVIVLASIGGAGLQQRRASPSARVAFAALAALVLIAAAAWTFDDLGRA